MLDFGNTLFTTLFASNIFDVNKESPSDSKKVRRKMPNDFLVIQVVDRRNT